MTGTALVRVDPIDRDIAVIIRQDFSTEARSRAIAEFALQAFGEVEAAYMRRYGRAARSRTWVDRRESTELATVKPDGEIVREYDLATEALELIRRELERTSPRLTGRYAESHVLFADDIEVQRGQVPPPAQEYVFVSTLPYSRKLERLYAVYANAADRNYGAGIKVRFTHRSVRGGAIDQWAGRTRLQRRRMTRNQRRDWLTRQPAIVVTLH